VSDCANANAYTDSAQLRRCGFGIAGSERAILEGQIVVGSICHGQIFGLISLVRAGKSRLTQYIWTLSTNDNIIDHKPVFDL
jgi:hypothetical protein